MISNFENTREYKPSETMKFMSIFDEGWTDWFNPENLRIEEENMFIAQWNVWLQCYKHVNCAKYLLK